MPRYYSRLGRMGRAGICLVLLVLAGCGEESASPTPAQTTLSPSPTNPPAIIAPTVAPALTVPGPFTVTAGASLPPVAAGSPTPLPPSVASASPLTTTTLPAATSTAGPLPAESTPAPRPVTLQQIGPPGCCQEFAFGRDGRLVYYDLPMGAARPGTYTYDPATGRRGLLTSRFGTFSLDLSVVAVSNRNGGQTSLERTADGAVLATLPNRAAPTLISPDNRKVAYLLRLDQQDGSVAPQRMELWTGNLDGTGLQAVWSLREGDNLAWFPDSRRLLLTARDASNRRFGLWVVDTQAPPAQSARLVIESKGLIAAGLSGDGRQVAYVVTFQGEAASGVWVADSDGANRRKMTWEGSWRWSATAPGQLFYLPVKTSGATSSALWVYNAVTGQSTRLTDPATTSFMVAAGQWQLAPDNRSLAFRNAADNALWRLSF